jgi:putative hydrolase of the HAD superfamily
MGLPMIKVVCFDIDGTLYPKWVTNRKLFFTLFPSPSLALKYQKFRKEVRQKKSLVLKDQSEQGFRRYQAKSIAKQTKQNPKEIEKRIESQFYHRWEKIFANLKGYADVSETLVELKNRGYKLAFLSDFPIGNKLKALKVDYLVDYAICSEQSGYLKPHESPFLAICNKMNVTPQEVVYVGDSYFKDIMGAKKVGMKTLWLVPKMKKRSIKKRLKGNYSDADAIFSNYSEFIDKLEKIDK